MSVKEVKHIQVGQVSMENIKLQEFGDEVHIVIPMKAGALLNIRLTAKDAKLLAEGLDAMADTVGHDD